MRAMSGGDEDVLKLPAVLDLAASEDFLGTVLHQLQSGRALCLDASAVETLTLPCVQIILAAIATHRVSIADPSEAFASAFRDLALDWGAGGEAELRREPAELAVAATEPVLAPMVQAVPAPDLVPAPEPEAMPEPEPAIEPGPEPIREPEPATAAAAPMPCATPIAEGVPQPLAAAAMPPTGDAGPSETAASSDPNLSQLSEMDGASMAKRILTIDDSKTMRDMLMLTLAEAGFEVLQAVDGQHGLDVLGDERVDVVITDINMPKMDGYGVIRNLRKNPVHKSTPILVLTTESDTEKRIIAREAGATGWMVKPFDPDRLIATIRKVAP
jgi:CheY-like chemotaxis protein